LSWLESESVNWGISGNIRRLKRKSFIGQAVLLALAIEILVFASFSGWQFPVPTQHNLERFFITSAQQWLTCLPGHWQEELALQLPMVKMQVAAVRYTAYVPLVPAAVFIGYILGVPLGLAAVAGFLLLGLIGPYVGILPLASGGGIDYWRQPTFGYLIGIIGGAWFAGRITMASVSSLRQVAAIIGALLITHIFGLLYLFGASLGLLLFQGDGAYLKWQPWLFESVRNLSWYTLPYDGLLSLGLIGIGFPFRWLVSMLTAPDIGMKAKPKWEDQLAEEQIPEPAESMA
jgi:biotin transporter BioY